MVLKQRLSILVAAADIQNNIFYVVGGDYYTLQWQGFDATTGKTVVPMQKADVGDQAQSGVFWPSKGLLLAVLRGGAVLAINPKTAVVQTVRFSSHSPCVVPLSIHLSVCTYCLLSFRLIFLSVGRSTPASPPASK